MEDEPVVSDGFVVDAGTGGGSRRSCTLFVLGLLPLPFVPGAEARSPEGAIDVQMAGGAASALRKERLAVTLCLCKQTERSKHTALACRSDPRPMGSMIWSWKMGISITGVGEDEQ